MRLKDKLGNRANASAEIEYDGAFALALGERGRRRAHDHRDGAPHPARHRAGAGRADARGARRGALVVRASARAFQRRLIEQPLMAQRAGRPRARGRGGDWRSACGWRGPSTRSDRGASRGSAVALAKFLNNKRCPRRSTRRWSASAAIGYVEEGPLPRLYREAPLNSIWEGSGNVICLDVAARHGARARRARPRCSTSSAGARRRRPARRGRSSASSRSWPTAASRSTARAPPGRTAGAGAAGQPPGAPRAGRGRRRVLRLAPGRRRRPPVRHPAARARPRARSASGRGPGSISLSSAPPHAAEVG